MTYENKAQYNRKKLSKLANGELSAINLWRTEKSGTVSGMLTRDVYIGTLRTLDTPNDYDDSEYAPAIAEYGVSKQCATSNAYLTLGWVYRNSDNHWSALVDTDYGVELVGSHFTSAVDATRAITE